ncbi:alkylmercury lyase family protein [Actinomadura sp. 9N215]|uniref:alkylmercury lyase family protein n=1 Tax=Actinomadura sp. 9N215 TaxID=3375150 RepID=UPI0037A76369
MLYATRRPVSLEQLGGALGSSSDAIEPHVDNLEERGRLIRSEDRLILGIAGLSAKPTQHVFVTSEGPRWTWCAWDALGISALQGRRTIVRSHCPQTGTPIEVRFSRRRVVSVPRSAVLMMPDRSTSCVTVEDWCPLVNLMESPESAKRWLESNDLSAAILPIREAAFDSAHAFRPLLHPLPIRDRSSGH